MDVFDKIGTGALNEEFGEKKKKKRFQKISLPARIYFLGYVNIIRNVKNQIWYFIKGRREN